VQALLELPQLRHLILIRSTEPMPSWEQPPTWAQFVALSNKLDKLEFLHCEDLVSEEAMKISQDLQLGKAWAKSLKHVRVDRTFF